MNKDRFPYINLHSNLEKWVISDPSTCDHVNTHLRKQFRLAQSNREPFVSDIFESLFNKNATLAACVPLHDSTFRGLLFSAFQLNQTGFAEKVRAMAKQSGVSLIVTDANGVNETIPTGSRRKRLAQSGIRA